MRIIAGKAKYKRLYFKKNPYLRPTRNIVRKSFFDTMAGLIEESVFLDLFAGSGSVGMEALSRGAKKVIFVDNSPESLKLIRKNTKGFEGDIEIIRSSAESFIYSPILKEVTVAYLDPPYDLDIKGLLEKLFNQINKNAIVCVEHNKNKQLSNEFGEFKRLKTRSFGKNTLDYFGVVLYE